MANATLKQVTSEQLNNLVGIIRNEGVDPEESQVLLLAIKGLQESGLSIDKAYDLVIGEGAFQKLADECWEKLNGGE